MENTQHMRLFRKSMSKTIDCWASVTAKVGEDKFASANMSVTFSDSAYEKFNRLCKESKTKGTDWVNAEVTHSWLKPEVGSDGKTRMTLFINDFKVWQEKV